MNNSFCQTVLNHQRLCKKSLPGRWAAAASRFARDAGRINYLSAALSTLKCMLKILAVPFLHSENFLHTAQEFVVLYAGRASFFSLLFRVLRRNACVPAGHVNKRGRKGMWSQPPQTSRVCRECGDKSEKKSKNKINKNKKRYKHFDKVPARAERIQSKHTHTQGKKQRR